MGFYDFYDGHKVSPLGRYFNTMLAQCVVRTVGRHLRPADPVVEIGCGDGRVARALHASYRYTGYEPGSGLAERLRKDGITVRQQMVPPLTEADGSQRAVVAMHVLEHMTDLPHARQTLSEAHRVLADDGVLVLLCPDLLDQGPYFFDIDYSHSFATTPNRVYQLLMDTGFVIEERSFRYGALPIFPGHLLNVCTRVLFWFLNPYFENFTYRLAGVAKLRSMFARAFMFVARKKPSASDRQRAA